MSNNPSHPRSGPDEHDPYFARYIELAPAGDICSVLEGQIDSLIALLAPLPDAAAEYRYAEGKWSIKEVVGHVCDTERVMTYRALRTARGDTTPLSSFDENAYVDHARFEVRTLTDLLDEMVAVRRSSVCLFRGLADEAWTRRGTANGRPISVRALAYIVAGHELHHRRLLEQRYMPALVPGTAAAP